jgi:hypothetical protein
VLRRLESSRLAARTRKLCVDGPAWWAATESRRGCTILTMLLTVASFFLSFAGWATPLTRSVYGDADYHVLVLPSWQVQWPVVWALCSASLTSRRGTQQQAVSFS